MRKRAIGTWSWCVLCCALAFCCAVTSAAAERPVRGDFNGDGYSDLAAGAFWDGPPGKYGAGTVTVLYGSASGLSTAGVQMWDQDSPGILDDAEANDHFGASLASGDFNDDGYSDLAVGVPWEVNGSLGLAEGAVQILYGSANGLTAAGSQIWHQDSPGILDVAESLDRFGWSLAVGDLNGDGFTDLAVGVDGEDSGNGAVNVLYGSANGLAAAGNQFWRGQVPGGLGFALAAGDFDADGFDDLAAAAAAASVNGLVAAGRVGVVYGSGAGLVLDAPQFWDQESPGVPGSAALNDFFGWSLTTGDFDGDRFADLAVGVLQEAVGTVLAAGGANVFYGSESGLSASRSQLWHQDSVGVEGVAEANDAVGRSVLAADFNGDGFSDLILGAAFEDVGNNPDAGAINVLYGSSAGLSPTGNQFWNQNLAGLATTARHNDFFGWALAAGDFDGDHFADLAVGVLREASPSADNAGAIQVLRGSLEGLSAQGERLWCQGCAGIPGVAVPFNAFGASLGSQSSSR